METIEREITLTKQRSVSLKKGLSKLKVEIVWKPNSRALRSSNYDFDVDFFKRNSGNTSRNLNKPRNNS